MVQKHKKGYILAFLCVLPPVFLEGMCKYFAKQIILTLDSSY